MTNATLSAIYRHPVKGLGEQALGQVTLGAGEHMPWDRVWAIAHGGSEWNPQAPAWVRPRNFVNRNHVPAVAQVRTSYEEGAGMLTLSHPGRPDLSVVPDTTGGATALTDWIAPLAEGARPGPYRLCRLASGGLTDFAEAHIAIASRASLQTLEEAAGHPLAPARFRMNLWLDGLAPWQEFDWVGREIQIGPVRIRVDMRDPRCQATAANPQTGQRDVPVPDILRERFGHTEFGLYARVVAGGTLTLGDLVQAS